VTSSSIAYLLAILWNKASISSRFWDIASRSRPWPFRVTWRHRSRDYLIPR